MPTAKARQCKRPATVHYELRRQCVKHYCAQHDTAGGHSRLLRIRPWEYDARLHYGGA